MTLADIAFNLLTHPAVRRNAKGRHIAWREEERIVFDRVFTSIRRQLSLRKDTFTSP
jgi:hypothetical protein